MNEFDPKLSDTRIGADRWEWIPQDFNKFLVELAHVVASCHDHLVLFRGHRERRWLLDSTFARSLKSAVLGVPPWIRLPDEFRLSIQHQQIVANLFFFKFGFRTKPSEELFSLGTDKGIDPWFEWMRRLQQYSEEDEIPLKGTFLMDWTQNSDVGLFFANDSRSGEGALWICDATATGKTLHQQMTVGEILAQMEEQTRDNASLGIPLIFHPQRQLAQERATNQSAVYIAQMDLRVDAAEVWDNLQGSRNERILIKLVLPAGTTQECERHLQQRGITRRFLFPDLEENRA